MGNLKISQLTPGSPAQSGDLIPVDRSGTNVSVTASSIGGLGLPSTANTGDTVRYNEYGDNAWDAVIGSPRVIQVVADGSNNPATYGHLTAPVTVGTRVLYAANGTEMGGDTYTSAASGSTAIVACIEQGFGASSGFYTYGPLRRYSIRLIMNNTSNVRYWIGFGGTSPQFGTTAYSTDTPNLKYVAFRFSSGTDTTIKAVTGTSSGSQTVVDTGVAVDTTNSQLFDIVNTGSSFKFYINGSLKATISTTIPAATDLCGTGWWADNKNTATAVGATMFYSNLTAK